VRKRRSAPLWKPAASKISHFFRFTAPSRATPLATETVKLETDRSPPAPGRAPNGLHRPDGSPLVNASLRLAAASLRTSGPLDPEVRATLLSLHGSRRRMLPGTFHVSSSPPMERRSQPHPPGGCPARELLRALRSSKKERDGLKAMLVSAQEAASPKAPLKRELQRRRLSSTRGDSSWRSRTAL
jgi:hypothetical protein